uniref:Uncharacterized protein n=1 Tax=Zea mays TaxID=4577 RepID=C4J050_MAIZE|nr:unknown [Zea mays]ACR37054.1 unknown [Zea mays]
MPRGSSTLDHIIIQYNYRLRAANSRALVVTGPTNTKAQQQ